MDNLERAYYNVAFRCAFLERKGDSYQDLFADIMSKGYPGDYMPFRPWGNQGDHKCDGYLRSKKTVFQVYAPNEMDAKEALNKMDKDFHGAIPHWKERMSTWVFTHNSRNGLGPNHNEKLLELSSLYEGIAAIAWGYEELRRELFRLAEPDIIATLLVGRAPSLAHLVLVDYGRLQEVLNVIAWHSAILDQDFRPVPPSKLTANQLSDDTETLLRAGMQKSAYVGEYFHRHLTDPNLGNRLAATFRQQYEDLRNQGMSPDDIFRELYSFVGGMQQPNPVLEASALAVLAYFFETCDIFERPEDSE